MKLTVVLSGVLLSGCAVSNSLKGALPFPTGDGKITVPNVFGLPKIQAIAALRAAGYQGDISDMPGTCGSVIDGRVIELDHICGQAPSPGTVQGARIPIALHVQTENPWHGDVGKITEWYLMPNIIGMPVEAARNELVRTGFTQRERAHLYWVDQPGCRPLTVCETYPEATRRFSVSNDMNIMVGRDPSAPTAGDREAAPEGHADRDATPARAPNTEHASVPPKPDAPKPSAPKPEPKAEPFF